MMCKTEFFLIFVLVNLMASPEVIKIPFNSNAITPAPTSAPAINISMRNETKSWHVVDVWKVSVTTFVLILISVRPFDYFSYLCNEDEDVQKAKFKAILNFYKKIKKIIAKEQTKKDYESYKNFLSAQHKRQ